MKSFTIHKLDAEAAVQSFLPDSRIENARVVERFPGQKLMGDSMNALRSSSASATPQT